MCGASAGALRIDAETHAKLTPYRVICRAATTLRPDLGTYLGI
jgi:hypothetical protein